MNRLATANGATTADQDRIDSVMARGCAVGIVSAQYCRRHTVTSDARRKELGS